MSERASSGLGGIAVIGFACRVPGADTAEDFWHNLVNGVESIRRFTRQDLLDGGVDPTEAAHPGYVPAKGVLDQADRFDAALMGFAPREASLMDPQHRVMLECAWEALEHAGHGNPAPGARVAVYAGVALNTYLLRNLFPHRDSHASDNDIQLMVGNDKDYVATRISYEMNFVGPSVNVQTACSTSLVAVQMACTSLLTYQCDMALAGGAAITVPLNVGYLYREGGILSPDGHCRPFDAQAQGTVPGNGAGMILLKRLDEAIADGDTIHAVIAGSAVNNDGSDKIGYTAPSVAGQTAVIAEAHALAGVRADTIGYVEAHGTGTPLGDPIEVTALTSAFRKTTSARGYCALGSVKGNIGHLDTAAGIIGFIKAVLAVRNGVIPPGLHFERPNPALVLEASPFYVPTTAKGWGIAGPRRAGVSSFGIGGTNAHVVIEEPPKPPAARASSRKAQLLCMSARTPEVLERNAARLAPVLDAADILLADVAFTLARGRRPFPSRRAVVATTATDAAAQLRRPSRDLPYVPDRTVVWLFPGQGAQHVGMGAAIAAQEPEFRRALDEAAGALLSYGGPDVRRLLAPTENGPEAQALLSKTENAQAVTFALEYALAQLWESWGVRPSAVLGHSVGEFAAAVCAGVMTLADAARMVCARGRLMQALPAGAMLAVRCGEDDAGRWLRPNVSLSAINAPDACVLGGSLDAIAALERELREAGVEAQRLRTSHAFHTEMMDPMLAAFRTEVADVSLRPPVIPWMSSVTGAWISASEAVDPDYLVRQVRAPVRFAAAAGALLGSSDSAVVEVGPGDTLTMLARKQASPQHVIVSSCGRSGQDEAVSLTSAVGTLWVAGVPIDWKRYYGAETRRRVALPSYSFERQRYWIDPPASSPASSHTRPSPLPTPGKTEELLFEPVWVRSPQLLEPQLTGRWLIITDAVGVSAQLGSRVSAAGGVVRFASPFDVDRFATLIDQTRPDHVLHLGNVTGTTPVDQTETRIRGYGSVVALGEALSQSGAKARLTIVSDGMQAVTGQEVICAEKALVLGPVRVLPQEYPVLKCRSVDIEVAGIDGDRLTRLLAECVSDDSAPVVAHRGQHRWIPSFKRLAPAVDVPALRRGGVYLITGGLGGIGLTLARHLWDTTGAKLVLTGRTPLPPLDDAAATTAESDDLITVEIGAEPAASSRLDALADAWIIASEDAPREASRPSPPLSERQDIAPLLNEISISHIYEFFGAAGIDLRPGCRHRTRDLAVRIKILPAYQRFVDFFVAVLIEDGFARRDGDEIVIARDAPASSDDLGRRAMAQHPWLTPVVELLAYSASHYLDVLSGRTDALAVLYPKGGSEVFERVVASVADHARHRQYCAVIASMLGQQADRSEGTPLRILEIGGGNGFLTRQVAKALAGKNVEYVFTDISRAFVDRARLWAAGEGLDRMKFGIFDITRDAASQGLREPFDVVLALDAVHATKDVGVSLSNLRRVLRPGGVAYLVETLPPARWNTMAWGLARDWWSFDDRFRTDSPLLFPDRWIEAFRSAGFDTAGAHLSASAGADCALYFARNPWIRDPRPRAAELAALKAAGADVLALTADVTSTEQMKEVVSAALHRFGVIHGVVHAASEPIALGAKSEAQRFAKSHGVRVLAQVLADQPLDFLLLSSSTTSLLGGVANSEYSAENAFLDAFAHERAQRAFPVVSVNWDRWQGTGMGSDIEARYAARMGETPAGGLAVPQALACFDRIVALPIAPRVVATSLDLTVPDREGHDIESIARRIVSADHHARQAMSTPFEPPLGNVEQRIAAVWEETLGVSPIGRHDDYLELGGDSLIAIKVAYRLREVLGFELRVAALFESPTVARLAGHLEEPSRTSELAEAMEEGEL
jgi:acyl transferase domain-containing protein